MLFDTLGQVNSQILNAPNMGRQTLNNHAHNLQKTHDAYPETWYHWLKNQYIACLNAIGNLSPRHYQTQTSNSPKATGKLNIKAQIKHNWHRPHYRASEQSQLVDYELLWRFLLTGYQQLQFDGQSTDTMLTQLQGINPLSTSEWHPVYTRLLQDLKTWRRQLSFTKIKDIDQAIAWSWWLMTPKLSLMDAPINYSRALSDHTDNDINNIKLPKHAFMLNMNQLFEQWVSVSVQRWCDSQLMGSRILKQPSFDWLKVDNGTINNGTIDNVINNNVINDRVIQRLRPDICIVDADDKISHVIEIKYKQFNRLNDIASADLYQLNSYQQHLQASNAWLIYPQSTALMQLTKLASFQDKVNLSTTLSLIPFEVRQGRLIINS